MHLSKGVSLPVVMCATVEVGSQQEEKPHCKREGREGTKLPFSCRCLFIIFFSLLEGMMAEVIIV